MGNITKDYALTQRQFGGVPYGNKTVLQFTLKTNASGVMVDSDKSTAIAANDVVRLGLLPAGTTLVDALTIVSDVGQTATTGKFGFAYVDGVDDTTVPQDADYFHAALALDAQSRTRANNVAVVPVTLPKDAYLTMQNLVAAQDEAMRVDVFVDCIMTGTP